MYQEKTNRIVDDVLIIRYIENLEMDCLELAVHCECKRFVSHPLIQRILDTIWYGYIDYPVKKVIILNILCTKYFSRS